MEKQRFKSAAESCKRLLIFAAFIILSNSIYSQNLTRAQLKELKIVPSENQLLYAKSELKFEVTLPGIPASAVQVQNPSEIKNVNFNTLRKTELYSGSTDTKIELWLNFDKKGTYKLPPLSIILNGKQRQLEFEEITITDNPANMNSRVVIKFSNGTTVYSDDEAKTIFSSAAGEKIDYTIYLQYVVQLVQFNWDLPKDSIFTQTESYEINEIKYREKTLTDELIPVASFQWTPLKEGTYSMPVIRIVATGYSGYRNVITIPDFLINVTKAVSIKNDEADYIFAEAFNTNYIHSKKEQKLQVSSEDCEKLAALRRTEKSALFNYSSAKKTRVEFENQLNLPSGQNEFVVWILYFGIAVFILLIIMFVIFTKKKKSLAKILISTGMICVLVLIIYSSVQNCKKYGIFKSGMLRSIPEETSAASNELTPGIRVRILEETEDWYYIEIGETGGWIEKDSLCRI